MPQHDFGSAKFPKALFYPFFGKIAALINYDLSHAGSYSCALIAGSLQLQQISFDFKAAAIPAERAIRRNHPMAGDHNRHRIAIVSHANRSKPPRPPDSTRDVAIAPGLPVRDSDESPPAGQLKVGPAQIQGKIELAALAGKVLVQFADIRLQGLLGLLELHVLSFPAEVARIGTDGLLSGETSIEFQRDQATPGSRQKQRSDRRFHRCTEKGFHANSGMCLGLHKP
jgi:hypothetical protein